ncbi:DNA polymerase I family protein with 3'-5'-exonuclease and polymerase domains (plasmid) [Cylindrospermum stagnale PCC 7417]|uniref:DNA polymerase I n=1 Tax=Cylindrospermum stagnale PCC 7417 TaxID=56107 RepID=K9X760_9NOST|nr:bifunctional 3'-5' exonuclease/DNA polymerase [Cylindrospermum stagnale]AFZ28328.1 DNA polymerase I family protein with 3'-5'-exonuclease and polymerase domains [Cylindrospermum stagnale PCC 7417]
MSRSLINIDNPSHSALRYTLVSNVSTLNSALKPLFQAEVLALDCETTGLDPLIDSIKLIQIAAPNYPVVLIELPAIPKINRLLLKKLLSNSALKIAHNAKFDWQFLSQAGLHLSGRLFDTQLAYKVLTSGLKTSSSLQNIVQKLLQIQLDKTQQISDWCKPLTQSQLQYAALDAAILLDLYPILVKKLKQAKLLKIAQLEFRCMPVVAQMELNGMLFDLSRWQTIGAKLETEKTDTLNQLKQLRIASSQMSLLPELTDTINPNSPQQVLASLQSLGIPLQSTNQNALVPLAAHYPIIQALLDYRRLSKILGTFTDKLPQHIHSKTGRIHPNYYQLGARSGRFSCRNPPLQTLPRDEAARSCFIAAPGYKIIKADYSQIELRIMARLSGDLKMCRAYRQGADLHRLTASLVTGKSINEVTEEDRRLAKAINFGLIFGMGAAKLQIYAQVKYGVAMTLEQAKAFRKRFFEAYPGIARWHENIKRKYIQGIKESRTLAGRRRRWANKPRLSELLNHPVQGLNADINKLAMVKLSTTLAKFGTKLICVRHDEIVLECPETEVDQVSHILHNCMVAAAQKFLSHIPVVIDIKTSNSW